MKLQNKKTDVVVDVEIRDVFYDNIAKFKLINKATGSIIAMYNSLAELNAEWKDYEGPKEKYNYYYLDCDGGIYCYCDTLEKTKGYREIGNYFETEEEAEKAVEKLKAWKRLKDKGFRFNRWTIPEEPKTPHIKLVIEAEMDVPDSPYDLGLLFGGEE